MVVFVLGAGCSAMRGGRTRTTAAAPTSAPPVQTGPRFPNQDLAAKYQAARLSPRNFDFVMTYARALSDFCRASLVDVSCGPACASGPVKYNPVVALDGNSRQLVEGTLPMLDTLMSAQGLSWDHMGQWAAMKGRLLDLAGRTAEGQTLIDDYALQRPDAVPVIRLRLELLREAGDAKESEAQCSRSRTSLKQAPEPTRIELLTNCVALHPANSEGRTDPMDYAKYLPKLAKDEQRLYRKHMAERCAEEAATATASGETPCARACACTEQAADKDSTGKCKQSCRGCRDQAALRVRLCKKYRAA
jgi:hypothetical protein